MASRLARISDAHMRLQNTDLEHTDDTCDVCWLLSQMYRILPPMQGSPRHGCPVCGRKTVQPGLCEVCLERGYEARELFE